jgi:hypothetical protein
MEKNRYRDHSKGTETDTMPGHWIDEIRHVGLQAREFGFIQTRGSHYSNKAS